MDQITAVKAKMNVSSVEHFEHSMKVSLGAIYGKEGENKDFADATPSGACWMQINHGRPAATFFKPGKKYYVTFTEVPD